MTCQLYAGEPAVSTRTVTVPSGTVTLFRLVNSHVCWVELSSLGAGINRMVVPDRYGNPVDVVLGYENPADYLYDSPCAGKTPGRFANRIARGRFSIDGTEYRLRLNDGGNALHGGPEGFQNRIWSHEPVDRGVCFFRVSPDGEEDYPGNLRVSVTYRWNDDNTLSIDYEAETDIPTIVNLTNHAYFNLRGAGSGDCLDHLLSIRASRRVPSDSHDIPTGQILPVENTPFDFRRAKPLGRDLLRDFENLRSGKGYNHYFLLDGTKPQSPDSDAPDTSGVSEPIAVPAASLYCETTGIRLDVETSLPGLMLYTGNWLDGAPVGHGGVRYHDYSGVALECQLPPDAPNHLAFPSAILRPGTLLRHRILYRLSSLHGASCHSI